MIYILLFGFVFFSFLLIRGTGLVMEGLRRVMQVTKATPFGITAFVLAFATSLPEFIVGVTASIHGDSQLVLGNVIGSNIANLSIVLGGAAFISGAVKATDEFLKREVFHTFLAGSLPLLLLLDQELSRVDGLILLAVYGFYNYTVLHEKRKQLVKGHMEHGGVPLWRRFWYRISDQKTEQSFGILFIAVAVVIFSADVLVRVAEQLALFFDLPILLIGLFIVALGTSLPELSFEIAAIAKKQANMAFGNILGSVVANSTLVLAVATFISPIKLDGGLRVYLLATLAFILIFFLFWLFVRTEKKLDRWEGVVLVMVYLLFAWFEFTRVSEGFLPLP